MLSLWKACRRRAKGKPSRSCRRRLNLPATPPSSRPTDWGALMFSKFFIEHPRFAAVVSLVITISGLISLWNLPVEEYPEISPPTLFISATYAGASADVVTQTVAIPIENEINGVEDLLYFRRRAPIRVRTTAKSPSKQGPTATLRSLICKMPSSVPMPSCRAK